MSLFLDTAAECTTPQEVKNSLSDPSLVSKLRFLTKSVALASGSESLSASASATVTGLTGSFLSPFTPGVLKVSSGAHSKYNGVFWNL